MVVAPNTGAAVIVTVTRNAPQNPPSHTHQGILLSTVIVGQGILKLSEYMSNTVVPTAKDTKAARKGL